MAADRKDTAEQPHWPTAEDYTRVLSGEPVRRGDPVVQPRKEGEQVVEAHPDLYSSH